MNNFFELWPIFPNIRKNRRKRKIIEENISICLRINHRCCLLIVRNKTRIREKLLSEMDMASPLPAEWHFLCHKFSINSCVQLPLSMTLCFENYSDFPANRLYFILQLIYFHCLSLTKYCSKIKTFKRKITKTRKILLNSTSWWIFIFQTLATDQTLFLGLIVPRERALFL